MALPPQNTLAWKVCMELLHILALSSTVYRLHYRWKIGRMWWDDYLVIVPLVADCLFSVLVLLRFETPEKPPSNPAINSYWFSVFLLLVVIWSTRIVLSLSLARVFPAKSLGRRVGLGLAFAYALTFLSAVLVTLLTCTTMGFVTPKDDRCIRGIGGYNVKTLFLPFALADYFSDVLLIGSSVALLWRLKLDPRERFLVLAIFSASILTLLSAVAYTVACFAPVNLGPHARFLYGMFASLEVAVALIVCNLAVVISGVYRALRKDDLGEVELGTRETGSRSATDPVTDSSLPPNITFTEIYSDSDAPDNSGGGFSSKSNPLQLASPMGQLTIISSPQQTPMSTPMSSQ